MIKASNFSARSPSGMEGKSHFSRSILARDFVPKSKKPAFFDYLRDLGRNRLFPARSAGTDFGENFRRLDRQIARIVTFDGLDEVVLKIAGKKRECSKTVCRGSDTMSTGFPK